MLIKADFHIHTLISDGVIHPRDVTKLARSKGFGIIAVTDHDDFRGSILALREGCSDVLVIYGAEVRTEYGDVLLLCPNPINIVNELSNLVDLAHVNNCLLIPAHPYDITRAGVGKLALSSIWDGVECWNGSSNIVSNMLAWHTLRNKHRLILANSDAHVPEMLGTSYNIVEVHKLTVDDVLEVLRKGHVEPIPRYSLKGLAYGWVWSLRRHLNPDLNRTR